MVTDDERYTEKEMLEFARNLCTKIWRTCLFLSLVDTGRISKKVAVEWYGCGEIDFLNCLNKFVKERRAMQLEIRAFRDEQRKNMVTSGGNIDGLYEANHRDRSRSVG